ncbi:MULTISPECIES: hypothetical protein [unclassified Microcoleus]|uniref:hypothetical protein n=1 Tax=unclassified Microcoleus TaxID=2642155 RepID=UPI002FD1A592
MNQETRIELFNSIASEQISSLGRDLVEVALDQIVNEGVLREIPVVNSIYNLAKATVVISQGLFIKKLIRFLVELPNVSYEKRQSFLEVINKNPQKKREFE